MKIKKILGFIQILFFIWIFLNPTTFIKAASSIGMGDIGYLETRKIANGVELEYVMGTNNNAEQKGHTIEIAKGSLTPFVTYGNYINGGEKLTSMITAAESQFGKTVVAAMNGDFYDTSNAVPTGIMISNGRFVTTGTSGNSHKAIGFKADGSVIYGQPSITIRFNDGTKNTTINFLNNDRKFNETSIYMYTSDYGATTLNTNPGKEVVLSILSGDLKLGSTITAKVESTSGTTNTAIGTGKIVLSTAISNSSKFDTLTVGTEITISIIDNKANEGWSDCVQAIGFNAVLAENGVLTEITNTDTAIHPRSSIGIKEDGSIMLFQVDGRQPGWSNGLSYKQVAEHLVSKGCKTVVNLDGGGSSTLIARLPGDQKTSMLTSPSDGVERSNSNAIIFFATDTPDPDKTLTYLHTYPKNLVILEGAKTKIITKATDSNYYPLTTPTNLTYESGIGTIDAQGNFTARIGSGSGTITVRSGNISATVNVTVVDTITQVIADKTYLSISPGTEVEFFLSAYKDGMPIVCSNASFSWGLSSPVIGTINNGIFKGTTNSAVGSIYISYKNFKLTIPVEVGKQPIMINTFENTVMGSNWTSIIENPANGGTGTVSVNTDERFVKFGEKSLRIDYDFTKATGTTSVTSYQTGGHYVLDGYPTHIGMWVYGDMLNTTVRTLMLDGNNKAQYISYTPEPVTWMGWKYIEAEVPKGLPTPLKIQYPIRVMSISAKPKTAGTLYFDNLRVVYGFRNDDLLEPQVKNITPVNGTTVDSHQPLISMTVWDQADVNNTVTGIKKDSVKMWINSTLMSNVLLVDNPDGTITINYTPSALTALRSGPQIVKVRVEDNYGNITIKQWQFFVYGTYAGVNGIVPNKDMIFAGDTFSYYITATTYQNFEKLEATLSFNNKTIELKSIEKADNNITLGIVNITNANTSGSVNIVATGMKNYTMPASKEMIKITFGVKDGFIGNSDSSIVFKDVKVTETGYNTPNIFLLPSYEVKVNYPFILSYITSTVGKDITFTVTDHLMNPVKDASFVITGQSISVTAKTNEFGKATLSEFKTLAANATFQIKAVKGTYYSENVNVTMVASLRDANPFMIVVSPGSNASTSVNISWQTNLSTTNSVVKYRPVGTTAWLEVNQGITNEIHVIDGNLMKEYLGHIVTLNNLIPNTEYEYTCGATTVSSVLKFKTAPVENVSFAFFGDPQNSSASGYQITKSVIDAAILKNPNLSMMLFAGDMVDDGNMYSQWTAMESVLKPYLSSYQIATASGNHDVIRNYADPLKYNFAGAGNGVDGILGVNYYFEAGPAIIAFIDSETTTKYDAQAAWLIDVMNNSTKKFKIVIMHRSPYAANYNEPHIRDYWPKVFDQAKIDLVFSGHDHVYNATTMYNGTKATLGYGTTYVVGGSAGGKFYNANNLNERPWMDYFFDEDIPVFSNISIVGNVLTLESYSLSGTTVSLIKKIVLNKDLPRAKTIEIINLKDSIFTGKEHLFGGQLKDQFDQNISGSIKWKLKEDYNGITITNAGLLKVGQTTELQEVKIIAYYENIEYEITVNILLWMNPEEVVDYLIKVQDQFINDLYK